MAGDVPRAADRRAEPPAASSGQPSRALSRAAWADNLKVALVVGVIVAHVTIAWTGVGNWVFYETPVREPLFSLLSLLMSAALFGMAVFFFLAGMFTVPSLERKGPRRFLADRCLRLGVPLLFFVLLLAPVIEYVDPENAAWQGRFWTLAVDVVWWSWPVPPAWGPTWFLAVLLLFSVGHAVLRRIRPRPRGGRSALRRGHLVGLAGAVAAVTFLVRTQIPLGDEVGRLALGQAPAWLAGFSLGVVGTERSWFDPLDPAIARWSRHVAWVALAATAVTLASAALTGADLEVYAGGGTWQSLVLAAVEGALVVTMPLWLLDVFRRRFDHQGSRARAWSRAAFAAFVLHQLVLVGLVLASHAVTWPPELEFLTVATLGVVASFALGALTLRVPGVARVV
jgi:fucose 4-O-acetylase-like acetyltransferase